ncbi:upstream activation factor subunit spp27-like [Pistacia vera]|uniref:upstream activation factor subunit spp27-like n=1 Tax=Pistacia vera TaxID=55513 RepID=UPI001263DEBC|nr:upstream activation factor subunit spp27-like [Pistacia vera]
MAILGTKLIFISPQTLEKDNKEDNVEGENDDVEDEEKPNNVDKEVKKRGGGFNKLCSLSPQLQKFLGVSELARTQVVKKVWAYIKENNLQDPKNKKKILCDKSLLAIFRVNSIDMFQMNKVLSKHIWPLDCGNGTCLMFLLRFYVIEAINAP